jgi:fibronectin type 3 domain-containing protein
MEIARDAPPAAPEALAPHFRVVAEADGETAEVEIPVSDRFGQRTAFAVQAVTTKGKMSPWSELAVLDLVRPPGTPTELRADAAENGVKLAWTPVEGAAGYLVERASAEGGFESVAEAPGAEVTDNVPFDAEYRYRVRARADSPTGAVSGAVSETVSITPKDTFPPPAPTELRAVRTPQSVELSWASSPALDLEGYRVELAGTPLHQGLLTAPAFSHAEPPAGATSYQVIAVDRNGNASAPGVIEVE